MTTRNPKGRDPRIGHGRLEDPEPIAAFLPDWRALPDPRRGWWTTFKQPR